MGKIDLGRVVIVSNLSGRLDLESLPILGDQPETTIDASSLEKVQAAATFKIWQPQWLPNATLNLVQVFQKCWRLDGMPKLTGTFLKYQANENLWMVLEQSQIDAGRKIEIPAQVMQQNLANRIAAFFMRQVGASNHSSGYINVAHLLWEQDDFLMWVRSHGISLKELLRICESLE